jgi:hypothetical protein
MYRILTLKEVRELWKRLTPEQRKLLAAQVSEVIPRVRRSQFKLVPGGRPNKQPVVRDD